MRSIIIKLVLIVSSAWSVSGESQGLDYFNEDIIHLARLAWDKSIDNKTQSWLQSCANSENQNERIWAYIVIGVHLEEINSVPDSTQHGLSTFESNIIGKLNSAKKNNNIDAFLYNSIITKELSNPGTSHHKFATISDLLQEIQVIRYVRQLRLIDTRKIDVSNINISLQPLNNDQSNLIQLANLSNENFLVDFDSYSNNQITPEIPSSLFSGTFRTYRETFIRSLKKYYKETEFDQLSNTAKTILLEYWAFNLDLIKSNDRSQILKLMSIKDTITEQINVNIYKVMLRCLIENVSREEYQNQVNKLGDTKAKEQLLKNLGVESKIQSKTEFDSSKTNSQDKQNKGQYESLVIRPESQVMIFQNSSEDEILQYINANLRLELYKESGFIKNEKPVNIRAAIQSIGNLYYQKSEIKFDENKFNSIITTLVDIGTEGCTSCYGESSFLLYQLGKLSVPGLKQEFFSRNDARAGFSAQKLYELMDVDVVKWIIGVVESNPDENIRKRGRFMLQTMREYRSIQTPNRGISKEESERIIRELIDPYLAKN